MRCPNCSYISFDYLDRCVKCNADLTSERHRLNLSDIRPNPISLQEIMERTPVITRNEATQKKEEPLVKTQSPFQPKTTEIDLSQGLSLDISIPSDHKDSFPKPKSASLGEGEWPLSLEDLEININPEKKP